LLVALDLAGAFIFALTGALVAVRAKMDIVGMLVLATATGIGGGVVRDVLLGEFPPAALRSARYLVCCCLAGLLIFALPRLFEQFGSPIRYLDAVGLGVFAAAGTIKAVHFGTNGFTAVFLGVITAVGGGIIRDLLAGEIPSVLRSDIYAVAAALGSIAIVLTRDAGLIQAGAAVLGAALTIAVRLIAIQRGWQAPRPQRR